MSETTARFGGLVLSLLGRAFLVSLLVPLVTLTSVFLLGTWTGP